MGLKKSATFLVIDDEEAERFLIVDFCWSGVITSTSKERAAREVALSEDEEAEGGFAESKCLTHL